MDKSAERDALLKVFGAPFAALAEDHERPDFIVRGPTSEALGIEVTALYSTQAAAKLDHLPDYTESLLDGTRGVHRADRAAINVDMVRIERADGTKVDDARAIIIEHPTPNQSWELLMKAIRAKQRLAPDYLLNCTRVDLVVSDPGNLFFHAKAEDFQQGLWSFAPKSEILALSFREVYLITKAGEHASVFIPLIATLFMGDCFAYHELLRKQLEDRRSWDEVFKLLVAAMYYEGYGNLLVKLDDSSSAMKIAAWEMHYSETENSLRDWTTIPFETYEGIPAAEFIANSSLEAEAMELVERRKGLYSRVHLSLPIRVGNEDA